MKAHFQLLVFAVSLLAMSRASAQTTVTWATAPASNAFNNVSNWSAAPTGQNLVFGTTNRTGLNLSGSIDVNSLTFSGAYPSYSFFSTSSTSPVLGIGSGGITVGAQPNTAVKFADSVDLQLQANQTWTVEQSLAIAGNISASGSFTLTKAGAGELILSGDNTFAALNVTQGRLSLGNSTFVSGSSIISGPAGTGTITLASGTTLGSATTTSLAPSSNLEVDNNVVLGSGAGNNVTFSTVTSEGHESLHLTGTLTAGNAATTIHLESGDEPMKLFGTFTGPANTHLTFDSVGSEMSSIVLAGVFNGNIASVTADGAALFFLTAPPASVKATNYGYVGVTATAPEFLPQLAASVVLNSIASTDRANFAGTFGFDTDEEARVGPQIVTGALDFSAFTHADFRIGSMSHAVLDATLTPPTVGSTSAYRFGGSMGKLMVRSNLADAPGAPASVLVTSRAGTAAPYLVFSGSNTFTGTTSLDGVTAQLGVERSIVVLDSPNALPTATSKIALGAGAAAYIGYTEAAGFTSFADFTSRLAAGGYNSLSILGLDSADFYESKITHGIDSDFYGSRMVFENIDLRSFNSIYLGTASDTIIGGTVYAPSSGELRLTSASRAAFTIASNLGSNVTSVVLGTDSGASEEFGNGDVELTGANTYSGGTTLKSGILYVNGETKLSGSTILSGPIGTGTLTIAPGDSTAILAALDYGDTVYNPIVLNAPLQIGAPEFSTDGTLISQDYTPLSIAGAISGAGELRVFGSVDLQGTNTYTGGTVISYGQAYFGSASAFGSGQIALGVGSSSTSSSFAALGAYGSVTLPNAISTSGFISLGTTNGTLDLAGPVTLAANTFLSAQSHGGAVQISGAIGGANTLNLNSGKLRLSGTNTYSGGTTVSSGTLIFANAAAIPASGLLKANGAGYIGAAFDTNLQSAFLNRFDKPGSTGTIGLDPASGTVSEALSLSGFSSNVRIGTTGNVALTGTLTPSGNYRFGNGGGTLTVQSALSGSSSLNVASISTDKPLTVVLQGSNTFTGGTAVQNSIVRFEGASSLPASGLLDASSNGYIGYTENTGIATVAAFLTRFNSAMGANGIIGIDSANSAAPRTITEAISLSGFDSTTYLGTSTNVNITGAITAPGTVLSLTGVNTGSLVLNSAITGNALVVGTDSAAISANGTVTLNAASSYTGGTTLKYGRLIVGNSGALGTGTVTVTSDQSALSTNSSAPGFTIANNIDFDDPSVGSRTPTLMVEGPNNLALSGNLSGDGTLSKLGSGSLILSGINSAFEGLIEIYQGNLTFANDSAAGNAGLGFSSSGGATVNFQSAAPSIGQLSGYDAADQIFLAVNSTLTINQQFDDDFYGSISGSGAKLVIQGTDPSSASHLGLHGNNTYTGGTIIGPDAVVVANHAGALGTTGTVQLNGGTLAVHAGVTLPFTATHSLVVNDGRLGGTGTMSFNSDLRISGTSTASVSLAPGSNHSVGALTLSFSPGAMLILDSGGGYVWRLSDPTNSAGGWDTINVVGTVNIAATSADPFTFTIGTMDEDGENSFIGNIDLATTYSWTLLTATTITGFDSTKFELDTSNFMNFGTFSLGQSGNSLVLNFTPSAVPEPSTWALMITGIAVIAVYSYRRRKSA